MFAPSLDWDRQLFQRPQQLALALAKRGALVFYTQITPLEGNIPIKSIRDRLYVCSLPLEQFSILEKFFIYILTWNRKYIIKFDHPYILYDYLDEISAFNGDTQELIRSHRCLLRKADVVTATALLLYEDAKKERADTLHIPNGVDIDHFDTQPGLFSPPVDIAALCAIGKPVIGYYGAFANWFDYPLINDLALNRTDLNFLLIGPKHDNSLEASRLLRLANVHYLGPKPYSELPTYLACFDVAILPFIINQVTQSTSPIKLFEYFAGGKPVVSTPLREVMQYEEVAIGKDSQEFAEKIDKALSIKNDLEFTSKLKKIAQENTWEIQAERILQIMEQKLDSGSVKQLEMP